MSQGELREPFPLEEVVEFMSRQEKYLTGPSWLWAQMCVDAAWWLERLRDERADALAAGDAA